MGLFFLFKPMSQSTCKQKELKELYLRTIKFIPLFTNKKRNDKNRN